MSCKAGEPCETTLNLRPDIQKEIDRVAGEIDIQKKLIKKRFGQGNKLMVETAKV
jgi:hypothetical protein